MPYQNQTKDLKLKSYQQKYIVKSMFISLLIKQVKSMNNPKLSRDDLVNIIEEKCPHTGVVLNRYSKGRRLGKGGFAVCHELINLKNNQKSAVKIVEKASLIKSKAKQKLASQIKIHSEIKSEYVVKYEHFFQDSQFVYIILQLCDNQTLNELIKRRKKLTQLEAKYYMHQLVVAIRDIHQQNIIHRDLKLGNLLLTDKLQIRVGDFGLAAKVSCKSQRRKTMCGTPNYIAPQILDNINGHSFEVDIWSLGVIAYALIVGRPPFQTNDVKTTYTKIKNCNYSYPEDSYVSQYAKSFISKMLQRDPRHRATVQQLLNDDFFTSAPFPKTLPISTLACPPNANFIKQFLQGSQLVGKKQTESFSGQNDVTNEAIKTDRNLSRTNSRRTIIRANSTDKIQNNQVKRAASTAALVKNQPMISKVQTKLNQRNKYGPFVWVIYSEENPKFGMSYMLNSNAIGMRYNDSTSLISNCQFSKFKYFDSAAYKQNPHMKEEIFDSQAMPKQLIKKFKIIDYYKKQLKQKKQEEEGHMCNQQIIQKERLRFRETYESMMQVFIVKYHKNSNVSIFWFNNKDYQLIFKDSTELLVSKNHITYVNKVGNRKYFEKQDLPTETQQVQKRMKYAMTIMQTLKDSYGKQSTNANEDANKQNKSSNVTGLTRRQSSVSSQSQSQLPSLIRSSSMRKIQKCQKPKNVLMMKGSASSNRLATYKYLDK